MKIELQISPCEPRHKLDINIMNGLCEFSAFDLLTPDQLESLELELIAMTQQLYNYRKEQNLL